MAKQPIKKATRADFGSIKLLKDNSYVVELESGEECYTLGGNSVKIVSYPFRAKLKSSAFQSHPIIKDLILVMRKGKTYQAHNSFE